MLVTAMPQVKSRYLVPSAPHSHVPCALSTTTFEVRDDQTCDSLSMLWL